MVKKPDEIKSNSRAEKNNEDDLGLTSARPELPSAPHKWTRRDRTYGHPRDGTTTEFRPFDCSHCLLRIVEVWVDGCYKRRTAKEREIDPEGLRLIERDEERLDEMSRDAEDALRGPGI